LSFSDGIQILLNLGPLCESGDMFIIDKYSPEICNKKHPVYVEYKNSNDNDENEYNLIYDFFRIIKDKNPDILIGYNIFNFDEKYIFTRMEILSEKL
jgi:DNA polymerase elongation subunit (family B)